MVLDIREIQKRPKLADFLSIYNEQLKQKKQEMKDTNPITVEL